MREILFRGKRVDNGEWVEGDFYHRIVHVDTFHQNTVVPAIEVFDGESHLSIAYYTVDPETVGQFTGLCDKNGKKIFEGDIVRCIATMRNGKELVGYILYDDCCFCVKENRIANRPAMDLCDAFEVIGNIHDNPELLKVGAEDG